MTLIENTTARHNSNTQEFDGTLSPQMRLRSVVGRLDDLRGNDMGLAYHVNGNNEAEVVFSNLDGTAAISVPTPLSREAFNRILARTLPLDETKFILFKLAEAYDQKTPLMLEGGTAIGKTYAVNLFAKFLYGERAKIPDFYCNGQTDVSELLGKYVPCGASPADQARIKTFLDSEAGKVLKAELRQEAGSGPYSVKELYVRAAAELGLPLDRSNFEFQLGVLPKAMTAGHDENGLLQYRPDGPGVMLHIQEVGMAAPAVVNALLQIRGERGGHAPSIQVHQDGGREVVAGPGFFVVFSTNPPGKGFQERFEVDKALARGLSWVNLPDSLSDESVRKAAGTIFSFDSLPPKRGTIIDLKGERDLGEVLSVVMARFHKGYVEMLQNGEPGRKQKVPVTIDSMWRVAALVQQVQIPSQDGNSVDIVATLRRAVDGVYVQCLQDKPDPLSRDMRTAGNNSLGAKVMAMFDQCLSNEKTDLVTVGGVPCTPRDAIERLTVEAMERGVLSLSAQQEVAETRAASAELSELRTLSDNLIKMRDENRVVYEVALETTMAGLSDSNRTRLLELIG